MAELKRDKNELMLDGLQAIDPEIDTKIAYSKHVVSYVLSQEGGTASWKKADIQGTGYLVRRKTEPKYRLFVKSELSSGDLLDTPHPLWELDCKPNYIFYKTEDPSKPIKGLWFNDDSERMKFEEMIQGFIDEMRSAAGMDAAPTSQPVEQAKKAAEHDEVKAQLNTMGLSGPTKGPPSVQVTRQSLRTSLHGLVDDDSFMQMLMQQLYVQAGGKAGKPLDRQHVGQTDKPKNWATPAKGDH